MRDVIPLLEIKISLTDLGQPKFPNLGLLCNMTLYQGGIVVLDVGCHR